MREMQGGYILLMHSSSARQLAGGGLITMRNDKLVCSLKDYLVFKLVPPTKSYQETFYFYPEINQHSCYKHGSLCIVGVKFGEIRRQGLT